MSSATVVQVWCRGRDACPEADHDHSVGGLRGGPWRAILGALFARANRAPRIDPKNVGAMQKIDIIGQHYTYSDMTGGQLKSVVLPQ